MATTYKIINFGGHGTVNLKFETPRPGPDTRVFIETTGEDESLICWISEDDIDNFTKDFKQLIDKYFI